MRDSVICDGCGHAVRLPVGHDGSDVRCPECGVMCEILVPTLTDEEEDGEGPLAVRSEEPACQRCRTIMVPGTTVCASCGYDRKPKTAWKPFARHWGPGLSEVWRIRIFLTSQGVGLLMIVASAFLGELGPAIVSYLVYTGMLAYLLGTYSCVDLTRNQRGRVTLTNTWRICFFPLLPVKLKLGDYDGVSTGQDRDTDMWDWIVLLVLLMFGCFPGLIWWYLAIHSDRFFVALTEGHGAPKYYLYRGLNPEYGVEMAGTINEVAFAA